MRDNIHADACAVASAAGSSLSVSKQLPRKKRKKIPMTKNLRKNYKSICVAFLFATTLLKCDLEKPGKTNDSELHISQKVKTSRQSKKVVEKP